MLKIKKTTFGMYISAFLVLMLLNVSALSAAFAQTSDGGGNCQWNCN